MLSFAKLGITGSEKQIFDHSKASFVFAVEIFVWLLGFQKVVARVPVLGGFLVVYNGGLFRTIDFPNSSVPSSLFSKVVNAFKGTINKNPFVLGSSWTLKTPSSWKC